MPFALIKNYENLFLNCLAFELPLPLLFSSKLRMLVAEVRAIVAYIVILQS